MGPRPRVRRPGSRQVQLIGGAARSLEIGRLALRVPFVPAFSVVNLAGPRAGFRRRGGREVTTARYANRLRVVALNTQAPRGPLPEVQLSPDRLRERCDEHPTMYLTPW
jgi:hypothetical protein